MCSNAYIELLQLVENVVSFLKLLINYSKLLDFEVLLKGLLRRGKNE